MNKLLRVRDRILLGIAFMGDVFNETRLLGGLVSKKFEVTYGWTPPAYRRSSYLRDVRRLLKTGDITKTVKGNTATLTITNQGAKRLIRNFPLIKIASRKWDGLWTIFMFDIEEVLRRERNKLRRKLLSLTFARLQKSVYITPHNFVQDLKEWVEALGLKGKVRIFRAKEVTEENLQDFVERLWKISKINASYQKLLDQQEKIKELEGKKRKDAIRKLKGKLMEIVIKDPFLPRELLPDDWIGDKARKEISAL